MPFPTEEVYIARAEAELEVRLPESFREFLLRSNGGEIAGMEDDWQIYPVFDDADRKRAGRSASHVVRETQQARRWRGFPEQGVAFAGNGSGDHLIFLPVTSNASTLSPTVYRWQHEDGEYAAVADDFRALEESNFGA